jgi:myo-inositol catabolism protein IolH
VSEYGSIGRDPRLHESEDFLGGDNIACVSMFGFPEKMNKQAPEAGERIEKELLK